MKFYRAMCNEEAELWLNGRNAFLRRFKWFSPDINWVKSRVQDGVFNHSKFAKGRYSRLLAFEIPIKWSGKEVQLDRRKLPTIKLAGEVKYKVKRQKEWHLS